MAWMSRAFPGKKIEIYRAVSPGAWRLAVQRQLCQADFFGLELLLNGLELRENPDICALLAS